MTSSQLEPDPLREMHRWLTEQIQCTEWALALTGDGGELTGNRGMRWHRQRGYLAGLREGRDLLRAAVRKMESDAGQDDDERACAQCGDLVATLSTDNLCDGCAAEEVTIDEAVQRG